MVMSLRALIPKRILCPLKLFLRLKRIYPMAKLKLDLHEIFNKGKNIDQSLNEIIRDAVEKRITLVEIIPGKGSGQLKKHVLRFLDQKHIKALYHRVEKDDKNFGRIFVHFKFN